VLSNVSMGTARDRVPERVRKEPVLPRKSSGSRRFGLLETDSRSCVQTEHLISQCTADSTERQKAENIEAFPTLTPTLSPKKC